jgi:hypothetical protein
LGTKCAGVEYLSTGLTVNGAVDANRRCKYFKTIR